tara:strand:- start:523 stop:1374 length:852 start_codon:yes stop_codon:yes gene_type:complete
MNKSWEKEIKSGTRFDFGKNWKFFTAQALDEDRIKEAEQSLLRLLGCKTISGKNFLDIGCGSGIFSLAARNLGAKVYSLDYDQNSVECTQSLKERFFPGDSDWQVMNGSVLDTDFIKSLGLFDIVYSWGVLHHTGDLIKALENSIIPASKEDSLIAISIYNDMGYRSKIWRKIKEAYCRGGLIRLLVLTTYIPYAYIRGIIKGIIIFKNPFGYIYRYGKKNRGMSFHHDQIDWLGGYPYEVAKPEMIFNYYKDHGFKLINLMTTIRKGCNQFCFVKEQQARMD